MTHENYMKFSVSINKAIWEHSHTHLFICVCGSSHITMAELNHCNREQIAKPKTFTIWSLIKQVCRSQTRTRFPSPQSLSPLTLAHPSCLTLGDLSEDLPQVILDATSYCSHSKVCSTPLSRHHAIL